MRFERSKNYNEKNQISVRLVIWKTSLVLASEFLTKLCEQIASNKISKSQGWKENSWNLFCRRISYRNRTRNDDFSFRFEDGLLERDFDGRVNRIDRHTNVTRYRRPNHKRHVDCLRTFHNKFKKWVVHQRLRILEVYDPFSLIFITITMSFMLSSPMP